MGKLIDTDDVKTWLKERIDGYESLHLGGNSRSAELKIIIDELPVRVPDAYDPDKVVEQLEKLKKAEQDRPDDCDEDGCGDGEQIYDDGRSQGRYEAFSKAIEIVKGGGVDA
jgi:hypothetical protein